MKATVNSIGTKTLQQIAAGVPFKFLNNEDECCVLVVGLSDASGTVKSIWDGNKQDHLWVSVIACTVPPGARGYRPAGLRLSVRADLFVVELEQIEPVAFRERSAS